MIPKTRRNMVHVYVTDSEKKKIEKSSSLLGISMSSYIKIRLFSDKKE